jgi:hypothetical protein
MVSRLPTDYRPGRTDRDGSPTKTLQPQQQIWKSSLSGVPYDIEVDVEISVGDAIAHPSHAAPRNLGIVSDKLAMLLHDPGGSFANNDEAHHHRLLGSLIGKEILLAHSINETVRVVGGRQHLIDIVAEPAQAYIGCASARMVSRSFGGRSPGVNRSTGTPSKSSNST